jgi:hypothetical protein
MRSAVSKLTVASGKPTRSRLAYDEVVYANQETETISPIKIMSPYEVF